MSTKADSPREFKSATRLAFEHWLRTGQRVTPVQGVERKFNPYHDPRNGRFTFAPGGSRSIGDAVFSDRRHLWKPKLGLAPKPEALGHTTNEITPATSEDAVFTDDRLATLQPAQYRPNPRARIGGNGGPPLNDPLTLEEAFPAMRDSPAGAMVALADNMLDLTGPARALTADLHNAEVKKLIAQIHVIDPDYRFSSLGSPQTLEGMANEIKALRFDRAVTFYRNRGEMRPLQTEILRVMQERADSAYDEAVQLYRAGKLRPRLSREEAIGNYVDRAVRRTLRQRLNLSGIDYSAGQPVRVIGREYDSSGTDRTFRIPDARVGAVALDVTLSRKTLATAQVRGFFSSDFKPESVIIVRPSQLGHRSTYLIKRPK